MPLWQAAEPLILASRSTVRQMLLAAAGVPVEVKPAEIDERQAETGAPSQEPGAIAGLLARKKAVLVERLCPGRLVLGADQVLAFELQRFSKPADRIAAHAQLRTLRGRTHKLHSAVAFVQDGRVLFEGVSVVRLTMREFTDEFLDRYLDAAGSAATTSVGAYQLEGLGVQLFERIEGDYFTALGLPLIMVLDFLRRRGCLLP